MALSLRERMSASMNKFRETAENTQNESGSSSIYWKLTTDDALNGQAVIRFLPQQDLDQPAWVDVYTYYFKNKRTQAFYNDQASRTYGKGIPDPVSEYNTWLWNLSDSDEVSPAEKERLQDSCKSRAQKHQYYANILVIKDSANPENEGKVFVFRFGKKIYDKIHGQMFPKFEDDTPCVPFDMFEGKNFRLISKKVNDYVNYDDSSFTPTTSAVADTDEEIEEILSKCHDLTALVKDPAKVTTYEKKLENLKRVIGQDDELFNEWLDSKGLLTSTKKSKSPLIESVDEDDAGEDEDIPPVKSQTKERAKPKKEEPKPSVLAEVDDDVDDILRDLGF